MAQGIEEVMFVPGGGFIIVARDAHQEPCESLPCREGHATSSESGSSTGRWPSSGSLACCRCCEAEIAGLTSELADAKEEISVLFRWVDQLTEALAAASFKDAPARDPELDEQIASCRWAVSSSSSSDISSCQMGNGDSCSYNDSSSSCAFEACDVSCQPADCQPPPPHVVEVSSADTATVDAGCRSAIHGNAATASDTTAMAAATAFTAVTATEGSIVAAADNASSSVMRAIESLVFDPFNPPAASKLLKTPAFPGNETVWLVPVGKPADDACQWVIVKAIPYHSHERVQELEASLGLYQVRTSSSSSGEQDRCLELPYIRTEGRARYEADMAKRVNADSVQLDELVAAGAAASSNTGGGDIYVPPLFVLTQRCPLEGRPQECAAHDRQVLLVFPYHPAGDGNQYLERLVQSLKPKMLDPKEVTEPAEAATMIAEALYSMCRDMFSKVARLHRLGYIMADHKLDNMVYDQLAGGFKMIDAEAVDVCPLGFRIEGGSRHTPGYAAPEQAAQLWVDSACDVYACGVSIHNAIDLVEQRLADMLLPEQQASGSQVAAGCVDTKFDLVWEPVLRKILPLFAVAAGCVEADPKQRLTAEEALGLLLQLSA